MTKHMEQGCEFDDLPMAINTHSKLYISATGQVFVRKPEDTETVEFVRRVTDADRKAALDAIENLFDYMLSCEIVYDSVRDDVELIRAALSSPAVPVIQGLEEAITVFEKGVPDLADYEIVGVYLADCEKYEDRCRMVAKAARAYATMMKGDWNV